ncbi:MAG: MFS transporter [Candidatus Lokiarchaeota archaeon]|nr:MFS transporter [Candidatus Lokiarchaeota archaeon]
METQTKRKFKAGTVFFLSLAVFAQEISFNFYDSQVPPLLAKYIGSASIIGFIMGIDNLIGLFLEPIVGNLSDNTKTKIGKRIPYLLIGIPLSAIAFSLIPFETSLLSLMIIILTYITTMLAFKAPAESLVPDFIVPEHRSKANALIKSMTAFSIIIAALLSEFLVDDFLHISFLIPAIIMIICLIIVLTTVKEKDSLRVQMELKEEESGEQKESPQDKVSFLKSFGAIFQRENRHILFLLISVFLMAVSWSSVRSLLTLYGVNALGMTEGDAGGMSLYAGIVFILLVFVIAYFSEKVNRLLFFRIGFVIFIIGFALGFAIRTEFGTILSTCIIAVGYGFIGANAIVILWNHEPNQKATGTYTGIYYIFFYGAYTVGGFIVGGLVDLTGWNYMFIDAGIFVTIGFIFAMLIKPPKQVEKATDQ